jgi:hypothetical protein
MRDWLIAVALIVSAFVVASSLVAAHYMQRYQISAANGDTAVWRVDTWNGKVELCTFNKSKDVFSKLVPEPIFDIECKDSIGGPVARQ